MALASIGMQAAWVALVVAAGCAVNPATGKNEISLVGEGQEIALGEQTAARTRSAIGLVSDSALQRYVRGLGIRLAAVSERSGLPWSFEVIDDPEVNAFAAPGGKIFITRGILPFLGSEAELTGVLGHEVGHVTARHSARQITRQQLATVGLVAGSVLSSDVASVAGGIQAGLGVLFLSYSRGDESQADELGFRYMRRQNFDVREMPKVFKALSRVGQLSGGGKVPAWQSSHPDPEDRAARAEARVAALPADSLRGAVVNRDAYLRVIDGLVFGPDPRQGYFEQQLFLHPDLKFRIDFPPGWQTQNRADAVVAGSPNQDATMQLSLEGPEAPDALLQKWSQQQGVQTGSGRRVMVNGNPATTAEFQAQDEQGRALAGRVMYLSYGGTTYQLLAYTIGNLYAGYSGVFNSSMRSFARLTDPVALAKLPKRLQLVRLPRTMTVEEFYREYPSVVRLEVIQAINGVGAGQRMPAGMMAKRVQ